MSRATHATVVFMRWTSVPHQTANLNYEIY
jgi:hypothetical protein